MSPVAPTSPQTGLLETAEAADYLGVHPKTLVRWVRKGTVRAMRTPGGRYRYRQADLDAFVTTSMARPDSEAS